MIFNKKISKITYEDVEDFCDQEIPEDVHLDYKEDFPNHLEKTIAALANTRGGIIIIGVEDDDGKPGSADGIPKEEGLRERVIEIVTNNIYPWVFPKIRCPSKNNKSFVVIKVSESHKAPHYADNRKKVYVRTDNLNNPNALATKEQIEWLRGDRKKSEEFGKELIQKAEKNFEGWRERELKSEDGHFGIATLKITPLFPREPHINYKKLDEEKGKLRIPERYFLRRINRALPTQNGIHHLDTRPSLENEREVFTYFQLNTFGLFFYKEELGRITDELPVSEGKDKALDYHDFMKKIYYFLVSASRFYDLINFRGYLKFQVELDKASEIVVPHPERKEKALKENEKFPYITKNNLQWGREINASEVHSNTISLAAGLSEDIAWSLGIRYMDKEANQEFIENNYKL